MKKQLKKWVFRLGVTAGLIITILLIIVLNPLLSYANKTVEDKYSIYHNKPIDSKLVSVLNEATLLVKRSELYDADVKLDICLDDGSFYTSVIKKIGGQAFARGFYDKVVVMSNINCDNNTAELNG